MLIKEVSWNLRKYRNTLESRENIDVLLPLIEVKHVEYQRDPSSTSLNRLRETRSGSSKTAKECVNEFWLKPSLKTQASDVKNETKWNQESSWTNKKVNITYVICLNLHNTD